MGSQHRHVLGALVVGLALFVTGCGDSDSDTTSDGSKGTITIGAFNFSESSILAGMYEGALEAEGFAVTVRSNLGSREVVEPALERGEIDLYPGYAATELEHYNKGAGEATPDTDATVDKLRARLEPKGITALDPSEAVNGNAFAVTRATAERLSLRKLSDLVPHAPQLVLGGPAECPTRPFCAVGLEKTYGLKFKEFKPLDAGGPLSKTALKDRNVDIALIFTTDGSLGVEDFVLLEDDKQLQAADNVIPIVRSEAASETARKALNRVSTLLNTEELIDLNKRADIDKEDPKVLADEWLKDNGFVKS